ncbi:MAG: molybdopterin-dependent oxidoreductase, partial [Steroidobacteraceae bacterium]
ECVIVSPAPGTVLTRAALPESLEVWGWAWGDAGIAHVEVSVDGGRVWSAATLAPRHERSWQRFRFDWRPRIPEGATQVELQCRATDARGQTQPLDGARNAVHKVTLEIAAAAK